LQFFRSDGSRDINITFNLNGDGDIDVDGDGDLDLNRDGDIDGVVHFNVVRSVDRDLDGDGNVDRDGLDTNSDIDGARVLRGMSRQLSFLEHWRGRR
jgi:hypothetical protein